MADQKRSDLSQLKMEHATGTPRWEADDYGDRHRAIASVQDELKDLGFYKGQVDGVYGDQTISAMKDFQKIVGLPPTGSADRKSVEVLGYIDARILSGMAPDEIQKHIAGANLSAMPVLRMDNVIFAKLGDRMNVDKAETIHEDLESLGFYKGPKDGIYGEQTVEAMINFQKAVGLPPTGTADRQTLRVLVAFEDVDIRKPNLAAVEERLGHRVELSKIPAFRHLEQERHLPTKKPFTP